MYIVLTRTNKEILSRAMIVKVEPCGAMYRVSCAWDVSTHILTVDTKELYEIIAGGWFDSYQVSEDLNIALDKSGLTSFEGLERVQYMIEHGHMLPVSKPFSSVVMMSRVNGFIHAAGAYDYVLECSKSHPLATADVFLAINWERD